VADHFDGTVVHQGVPAFDVDRSLEVPTRTSLMIRVRSLSSKSGVRIWDEGQLPEYCGVADHVPEVDERMTGRAPAIPSIGRGAHSDNPTEKELLPWLSCAALAFFNIIASELNWDSLD
jgi:hypothetical protein